MPRLVQSVNDLRKRVKPIIDAGVRRAVLLPIHYTGQKPRLRWIYPRTFIVEWGKHEFETEDPQEALDKFFLVS